MAQFQQRKDIWHKNSRHRERAPGTSLQQHSQHNIQSLRQLLGSQNNRLHEKEQTIMAKQREIRQFRQQLHQQREQIASKDKTIREKDQVIQKLERQLETSEQLVARFQAQTEELETWLSTPDHQNPSVEMVYNATLRQRATDHTTSSLISTVECKKTIKWNWRETKKAPCMTDRDTDAVVSGNTVYLRQAGTQHIHAYNSTEDTWSQPPDCLTKYCTLAVVGKLVTSIGGYQGGLSNANATTLEKELFEAARSNTHTDELFSLIGDERWTKVFPPMPTKRSSAVAVCSGTALIVAGGYSVFSYIKAVEVLNIDTRQWSTAADLPGPLRQGSAAICGDHIYILGGSSGPGKSIKSMYTCSVSGLLQSCQTTFSAQLVKKSDPMMSSAERAVWSEAAELPVLCSTCVTHHGRLLAIGGIDSDYNPTTAVHMYSPNTNTWEVVSHMRTARQLCIAAVLPNNKLMVVGGRTPKYQYETDNVEVATVLCGFKLKSYD